MSKVKVYLDTPTLLGITTLLVCVLQTFLLYMEFYVSVCDFYAVIQISSLKARWVSKWWHVYVVQLAIEEEVTLLILLSISSL